MNSIQFFFLDFWNFFNFAKPLSKGSSQIVIIFTSAHVLRWGGGSGSWATVRFFKMLFMVYCNIDTRVGKINIFKVLFWRERGHSKEYSTLCTLLIMLTILDGSLRRVCMLNN